jgi:hypothetical protein
MSKVLLKMKADVVNLSEVVKKRLSVQTLKRIIVTEFENYLDANFKKGKLTMHELSLAKELLAKKYNSDCWNFGNKSVTIEVFIKDPPTNSCLELIKLVNEAILEIDENIKLILKKFNAKSSYENELWNLLPFLRINENIKPFKELGSKKSFIEFIKNNSNF